MATFPHRRSLLLILLVVFTLLPTTRAAPVPLPGSVELLTLDGSINPLSAWYITQGIEKSKRDGAQLIVIELDTPGGSLASMKQIVDGMLASSVPIAVYVGPSGARAASAGIFLVDAAQVAAMAPATNLGAAHPVSGTGADLHDAEGTKITYDASAKARSLAELRDRNIEWYSTAVTESYSLAADEALRGDVIDLVQPNVPSLLSAIDGRSVATSEGQKTLHTANARIVRLDMSGGLQLLSYLFNPDIIYVLFLIGILGLLFEFTLPGIGAPGVLGGLLLLTSLVVLGFLSVNAGGILLIGLGVLFFVIDIKAHTHGLLSAGGVASVGVGSFLLFPPWRTIVGRSDGGISVGLIVIATAGLSLLLILIVRSGLRARKRRLVLGRTALVGTMGVSLSKLDPAGEVRVGSEEWSATALGEPIGVGEEVQVVEVEGLRLVVIKRF